MKQLYNFTIRKNHNILAYIQAYWPVARQWDLPQISIVIHLLLSLDSQKMAP